jgi:hypothetical protein
MDQPRGDSAPVALCPRLGTPEAEVDLRVGVTVRVVMRRPNGTEVEAQASTRSSTDRAGW